MTYRLLAPFAVALSFLAACDRPSPMAPPFLGTWVCDGRTYAFTDTTYTSATAAPATIAAVRPVGAASYVLTLAEGYRIAVSGVAAGRMTLSDTATGETSACLRA